MAGEIIIRFIIGGLIVSLFAVIGDVLRPKTFAGIFGAAPSVALATLGLTFITHGGSYAGLEGRSMIAGGIAFLVYSLLGAWLVLRRRLPALPTTATLGPVWFVVAFGLWALVLR